MSKIPFESQLRRIQFSLFQIDLSSLNTETAAQVIILHILIFKKTNSINLKIIFQVELTILLLMNHPLKFHTKGFLSIDNKTLLKVTVMIDSHVSYQINLYQFIVF